MARRKNIEDEEVKGNPSVVLFLALMIILLAFFIMLNSIAVRDEKRTIKALGSLIGSFGILPGGVSPLGGKARATATVLAAPFTRVERDLIYIRGFAFDLKMQQGVTMLSRPGRKIIRIRGDLLFDRGSLALSKRAQLFLTRVARAIATARYRVIVGGYTDDTPPQKWGLPQGLTNWHLSALRAITAMRFMAEKGPVSPERINAFGYGATRPVRPNDSAENRARNRRVEIVLDNREFVAREKLTPSVAPKPVDYGGFLFDVYRLAVPPRPKKTPRPIDILKGVFP